MNQPMNEPLNQQQFEDLIGAYALDALDPHEIAACDAYISENPHVASEIERLQAAAVWYGASVASSPPPALRTTLLDRARAARAPSESGTRQSSFGAVTAHIEAMQYMNEVLEQLNATELGTVTENGLSIRDLIAHLAVMESAVTNNVGNPKLEAIHAIDVDARTAEMLATTSSWDFDSIIAEWRTACAATREVAQDQLDLHWFGAQQDANTTLAFRAFETWIHAGDIAEITGGHRRELSADAFASMTDLSMNLISGCMKARSVALDGETARIVLTGPGGGEWITPLGARGPANSQPIVTITATTQDWCLRIGDRIDPSAFVMTVDGPRDVAEQIIEAASAFAML